MQYRALVKEILAGLIAFVYIFAPFSLVYSWVLGGMAWRFLWSLAPFLLLIVFHKKAKRFSVFIALHVLFTVSPLLLLRYDVYTAVPAVVLFFMFAVYSLIRKASLDTSAGLKTVAGLVALIAGLTALSRLSVSPISGDMVPLFAVLTLLAVSAVVVHMQMDNLDTQLRRRNEAGKFAAKRLYRSNYVIIFVFITIAVIGGASAILMPENLVISLFFAAGALITRLYFALTSIISRLFFVPSEPPPVLMQPLPYFEFEATELGEYPLYDAEEQYIEPYFEFPVWVTVGFIIAAISLLLLTVYFIYKHMNTRHTKKTRFSTDTETEKLPISFSGLSALFRRRQNSPKHPIRRAYRKKVNGHIKKGAAVKQHHNPKNIAEIIRQTEDIDELTKQYELVRYGRH